MSSSATVVESDPIWAFVFAGVEGGFRRVWPVVLRHADSEPVLGCADVEQGDEEGAEEAGEHELLPTTSCAWQRSHTVAAHVVQAQERKKREKLQEKERKKQEKLQKKQDKKKGKGSPEAPEDPNQVCSSLPPLCCVSGLVVDVCDLSSRDLCIFLVPHSRAQRRTKNRRRRSRPSGRSQRTFSQPQPQPHLTRSRSTRRRLAPLPGCFMLRIMPPPSLR